MGAKAPVSECLGQTTSVPFHLVRYVEGKDLAAFDQDTWSLEVKVSGKPLYY